MRTQWIRRLAGGAGLLAAAWLAVASTDTTAGEPLPPEVGKGLVEKDIAYLQQELGKGTPEKRAVPTLKATAMLIALQAQNSKDAGLRDQALKVAEALAKKDYAGAKTAAGALKAGGGGNGAAVKLHEQAKFDLAELMSVYRNKTVGGLNMEKDIRAQAKGVTDVGLAGDLGARTVLVAEYVALMPAQKAADNPAHQKKWNAYNDEMAKLAREISTEAAKGAKADKATLSKKLKALDKSCTDCHNEFRD